MTTEIRWAAFAAVSLFYLIYLTKNALLKKQGVSANRLGKGEKAKESMRVERILGGITLLMALLQYVAVFTAGWDTPFPLPPALRICGVVLILLGDGIFLCSVVVMRNNWRAGVDRTQKTELVTTGLYRYSRNPAFVGFDLLYLGSALALPGVLLWCGALAAMVLFHFQILQEEAYLTEVFGEPYRDYMARTPRYFFGL